MFHASIATSASMSAPLHPAASAAHVLLCCLIDEIDSGILVCDGDGIVPLVLLLLGRREPCSAIGLELFGTAHGLTLAERRVLAALLRDASPREVAAEHGVALSTIRTQILSLRAKLGARSIEGLL